MKLNKGDLAIVVGGGPNVKEHYGKVVVLNCLYRPRIWFTEPMLRTSWDSPIAWREEHLKPLRDSDGTDETLSWIDVPNEVTA